MTKMNLRLKEVKHRTGASRSSIYQWMDDGSFPRNYKIGRRAVAWLESEIDEWMSVRVKSRREHPKSTTEINQSSEHSKDESQETSHRKPQADQQNLHH